MATWCRPVVIHSSAIGDQAHSRSTEASRCNRTFRILPAHSFGFCLEVHMRKVSMILATIGVLVFANSLVAQQRNALQATADALGVARIKTLQFTGSGANFSVGQNYTPNEPWPRVEVKNYSASINYDTGSMRVELLPQMGDGMPRGGGAPFFGEQRQGPGVQGELA